MWGQEINEINEIFEVVTARALTQLSKYGSVSIISMEEALAATKLGYELLKTEQKEAVKAFVEGNDVFVSLPTGFGKTLCIALFP